MRASELEPKEKTRWRTMRCQCGRLLFREMLVKAEGSVEHVCGKCGRLVIWEFENGRPPAREVKKRG